jgi:hypothetical protein
MPDLDLNAMIRALPAEGGRIEIPPGEFDLVPPTPPPGAPPEWRPTAAVVVVLEGTANGASQGVLTAPTTIGIGRTALTFWRAA